MASDSYWIADNDEDEDDKPLLPQVLGEVNVAISRLLKKHTDAELQIWGNSRQALTDFLTLNNEAWNRILTGNGLPKFNPRRGIVREYLVFLGHEK